MRPQRRLRQPLLATEKRCVTRATGRQFRIFILKDGPERPEVLAKAIETQHRALLYALDEDVEHKIVAWHEISWMHSFHRNERARSGHEQGLAAVTEARLLHDLFEDSECRHCDETEGKHYVKSRRFAEALQCLERCGLEEGEDESYLAQLAVAHFKCGNPIAACITALRRHAIYEDEEEHVDTDFLCFGRIFLEARARNLADCYFEKAWLDTRFDSPEKLQSRQRSVARCRVDPEYGDTVSKEWHRICDACLAVSDAESTAFQMCSICQQVYYCSRECQEQHWPDHKYDCRRLPKSLERFCKFCWCEFRKSLWNEKRAEHRCMSCEKEQYCCSECFDQGIEDHLLICRGS